MKWGTTSGTGRLTAHGCAENASQSEGEAHEIEQRGCPADVRKGCKRRREGAGSEMGAQELSAHQLSCGCYTFERRSTDRYSARDSASVRSI